MDMVFFRDARFIWLRYIEYFIQYWCFLVSLYWQHVIIRRPNAGQFLIILHLLSCFQGGKKDYSIIHLSTEKNNLAIRYISILLALKRKRNVMLTRNLMFQFTFHAGLQDPHMSYFRESTNKFSEFLYVKGVYKRLHGNEVASVSPLFSCNTLSPDFSDHQNPSGKMPYWSV